MTKLEEKYLPKLIREVMLHNGIPDTNGFASHDAMHDSRFTTEWFNWPVSAEINYDRLMLFPQAGTVNRVATSTIDMSTY